MAVSITMNNDLTTKLLDTLLSPAAKEKLKHIQDLCGATATFGLLDFKIVFSSNDVLGTKLPVVTVNLLMESPAKKQMVAQLVEKTIEQAFIKAVSSAVHKVPEPPSVVFDSYGDIPPPTMEQEVPPAPAPFDWKPPEPKTPKAKPKAKPAYMNQPPSTKEVKASAEATPVTGLVKLADATELGQKVMGTTPGAVYRCVAVGPVNVAVKTGTTQVSIRIEGDHLKELEARLTHIGFSKGSTGKYWSMHLNLGDFDMFRALGSVLFSMDLGFTKIVSSKKEFM